MSVKRGRNFLMTPGPTNVPERVLQAMVRNALDISSPEFVDFTRSCLQDIKSIFKTDSDVFIYISNGHGAWEAALANTLKPGDSVLVPGTGHFSKNWAKLAEKQGLQAEVTATDWRHAVNPAAVEERLRKDTAHKIKAVLLVHTDTATSITNNVAAVRKAIDNANHPALYMVDAVASLGTTEFCMDEWRVDVTVGASQKGLMTPPGLGFTAASEKALRANRDTGGTHVYWDWQRRQDPEWYHWFCGTAPEHLLFALREAIDMLMEEGLEQAFSRHRRLAGIVRAAIDVWSEGGVIERNVLKTNDAADSVTTIRVADGYDANQIKAICHEHFNVSLGGGLSQLHGKAFRIGHMGDINEAMILGALASVEATFQLLGIPYVSGMAAAVEFLTADLKHS